MSEQANMGTAICAVMLDVKRLEKSDSNTFAKYKFTSVDDYKDMVRPLLAKNGLSIRTDEVDFEALEAVTEDGKKRFIARYKFAFQLVHKSGAEEPIEHSTVSLPYTGAQTTGQAKSYALKEYIKGRFLASSGDIEEDADTSQQQDYSSTHAPKRNEKPTYPKARSREPFAKLELEMRKITSLDELDGWWGTAETKEDVKRLPIDWQFELFVSFMKHGIAIAESHSAQAAFWGAYREMIKAIPDDEQESRNDLIETYKEAQAAWEKKPGGNRFTSSLEAG